MNANRKKTAFFSVFGKNQAFEEFARALAIREWEIMGSAGTVKFLNEKKIAATDVASYIGPPILGHKVVTLSRELYAGLLADESGAEQAELDRIKFPRIDLVYVSFYPLENEIAKPGATLASVLAATDIGGPTMLRAAAKGRRIALCNEDQFQQALNFIDGIFLQSGGKKTFTKEEYLSELASSVEYRVSQYCTTSSDFHSDLVALDLTQEDW